MGSGIFTRKAGEFIFHDKIQQSCIDLTRFSIGNRSNRSANKIVVVGIGEVTQFGIILSHSDKQTIQHTQANKKQANDKHTAEEGQIKRQGWSGVEENERKINLMRRIRVCDRYLVYDFCVSLPGNGAINSSCYFSSLCCIPSKRKGRCNTVA